MGVKALPDTPPPISGGKEKGMEMEENPESVNGHPVVKIARFAPDVSQRQNLATVVVDTGADVPERFILWDIAWNDGEEIAAENGVHDLGVVAAQKRFMDRVRQHDSMRDLTQSGDVTWGHFAIIQWDHVPVIGREEFDTWARSAAGNSRNFGEFYKAENASVAQAIERWLTRYSAAHTHPDLRK
jgi:hypothetical protein